MLRWQTLQQKWNCLQPGTKKNILISNDKFSFGLQSCSPTLSIFVVLADCANMAAVGAPRSLLPSLKTDHHGALWAQPLVATWGTTAHLFSHVCRSATRASSHQTQGSTCQVPAAQCPSWGMRHTTCSLACTLEPPTSCLCEPEPPRASARRRSRRSPPISPVSHVFFFHPPNHRV